MFLPVVGSVQVTRVQSLAVIVSGRVPHSVFPTNTFAPARDSEAAPLSANILTLVTSHCPLKRPVHQDSELEAVNVFMQAF